MPKFAIGYLHTKQEAIIEAENQYKAKKKAEELYKPSKKNYFQLYAYPCNDAGEVNGNCL